MPRGDHPQLRAIVALAVSYCATLCADAQETLDTLLNRGYVTQWLVCGPFQPDAEGGIAAAIAERRSPLGDTDFMAPLGGIARTRPRHLLPVEFQGAQALWQRAGADSPSLDLSPFFPDAAEGISYAAFYAEANAPQKVYFDLHSPLGVRVFHNGFPVRAIRAAPVALTGVDRFLLDFRQGLNLIVFQVPGATYQALADAAGITLDDLLATAFQNRTLLERKSGYEIALRIAPVRAMGELHAAQRLVATGTFSGAGSGIRQDASLTVFNNGSAPSPPVTVNAAAAGQTVQASIPPIPPNTQYEARLALPLGGTPPGQTVSVDIELRGGGETLTFTSPLNVLPPPEPGTVYVVTGARAAGMDTLDQAARVNQHNQHVHRQLLLMEREPAYGMHLGTVDLWRPVFNLFPDRREAMVEAILLGRAAPAIGFATPDERIAGPEILARNLVHGHATASALLHVWPTAHTAWNAPAIAPQTPQLLDSMGATGVISQLGLPGIPPMSHLLAPNGSQILHRHKLPSAAPASENEVRAMAAIQRRELLAAGFRSDILLIESAVAPPESFWLNSAAPLAGSMPKIATTGAGPQQFFEDVHTLTRNVSQTGRALNANRVGELATQRDIKYAHARAGHLALTAERWATIAALLGAAYPGEALDFAWRQLLYTSDPHRLGFAPSPGVYLDTLAALHDAAAIAHAIQRNAAAHVAQLAETYANAPARGQDHRALVVFNPSSWPRTDRCELDVELPPSQGLTLLNEAGDAIPFVLDAPRVSDRQLTGGFLRFTARDVPPLGYKVYYLVPSGRLPGTTQSGDTEIANSFWRIRVDPNRGGAIVSLTEVSTGREFTAGPWNGLFAIGEDREANHHGRAFWTNGPPQSSTGQSARIETEVSASFERITVRIPWLGGEAVQTITLYDGLPYIYCETTLRGGLLNQLTGLRFDLDESKRAIVHGERYGAVIGRQSLNPFSFQATGPEHPSGTGLQPALHWVALTPNDHVRAASGEIIPLQPAAVVYGRDGLFRDGARRIQRALAGRGIPADTWPDAPADSPTVYTDSTVPPSVDADRGHGTGFQILLGNTSQNRRTDALLQAMGEESQAAAIEALEQRGVVALASASTGPDHSPMPTVIIAAATPQQTETLARNFAEAMAINGVYTVPPGVIASVTDEQPPPTGLAVLFDGAGLAAREDDGTLALILHHPSEWTNSADGPPIPPAEVHVRYALLPFTGTWRENQVVQAAEGFNQPLTGAVTGLHLGSYPSNHSFVQLTPSSFVLTTLKPAGNPVPALLRSAANPRDGLILRGHETTGTPTSVTAHFFTDLFSASQADLRETQIETASTSGETASFRTGGFEIVSLLIQPSARVRRGLPTELAPSHPGSGPVFTQYWNHRTGAASLGFQPVSVVLRGDPAADSASLRVFVANNLRDQTIRGQLFFEATEGWTISPETVEYTLDPGAYLGRDVVVLQRHAGPLTGGIIARTEHAGVTYQDLLSLDAEPLALEVKRNRGVIEAVVRNSGGLTAEGFVEVIAPPAHWSPWPEPGVSAIAPGRQTVFIPPFQQQRYVFHGPGGDAPWTAVKLAANGHVLYQMVPPE